MAKRSMMGILDDPEKRIRETKGINGILAALWRVMLRDLRVTPGKWGSLMHDYVLDSRNGVPDNTKDRTSMRGNLIKEFSREGLTWKVFCKGLRFLQIIKIDLTITAHHENGRITTHKIDAILSRRRDNLQEFLDEVDAPDHPLDSHDNDDDHSDNEVDV